MLGPLVAEHLTLDLEGRVIAPLAAVAEVKRA